MDMLNAMDYSKGKTSYKNFALQYIKQEMGRAKLLPKTVRLSMPNAMDYSKGKTPKKTVRLSMPNAMDYSKGKTPKKTVRLS